MTGAVRRDHRCRPDPNRAEADLQAGKLSCPHCGGQLRGWSYAQARRVRQLAGDHLRWLRQRATSVIADIEPHILNRINVGPHPGGDGPLLAALTVLGAAVAAIRGRLPQLPHDAWTLIGAVTGGRLLLPAPSS